jgi:hypothetical protein
VITRAMDEFIVRKKIILHSLSGYRPSLDALVASWIERGVTYVAIIGIDAARLEAIIDELCVGDGGNPYSMLTACHLPADSLADATALAEQLTGEFAGPHEIIEL